jgi:hypothetical protein
VKAKTPPVFDSVAAGQVCRQSQLLPARLGVTGPVAREIPNTMRRIDPNLPVEDLMTAPQQVADTPTDRMISTMAAAFGARDARRIA